MADQLFEQWQVYEKVLIHDYMDHRAFFTRLEDEIMARFQRPVAILDLGCGDLTPIVPLLSTVPVRRYVGIDESAVALSIASARLGGLDLSSRLVQGDLAESLAGLSGPFDVSVASYALHHLEHPADKLRVLEQAHRLLGMNGFFAMIDQLRADAEPRAHYIERWVDNARNHYVALEPAEQDLLFDHVRARDFPVSLTELQALGKHAVAPRAPGN